MRATYPRKGLDWAGTRALAVEMQPLLAAATAMERFPNNVACNSPVTLLSIEIRVLQFQRLWVCLKVRVAELHATFFWGLLAGDVGATHKDRDRPGISVPENSTV